MDMWSAIGTFVLLLATYYGIWCGKKLYERRQEVEEMIALARKIASVEQAVVSARIDEVDGSVVVCIKSEIDSGRLRFQPNHPDIKLLGLLKAGERVTFCSHEKAYEGGSQRDCTAHLQFIPVEK